MTNPNEMQNNSKSEFESSKFKWVVFLISLVLIFIGCNKSGDGRVEPPKKQEPQFSIKGFYLGMPINDVKGLISRKYSGIFKKCTLKDSVISCGDSDFEFDSNGKLIQFGFTHKHTDQLFNSNDMSAKEFSQQFIDSYGIEKLTEREEAIQVEGIVIGSKGTWYYQSPKGFILRIDQYKNMSIRKIPSLSERGFD